MADSNVNLATLIGSRICHDLISPIGAINNGLELLDLAGSVQGPELDLIADSVGNAGARIRFFRIAYGAAGSQGLGRLEVISVLKDITRGTRQTIQWLPTDPQPRSQVRMTFLAIQCLETAMPYGGDISVNVVEGQWTVSGGADKILFDPDLWARLSGEGGIDGITPAQVQFALLPQVAKDEGRPVHVDRDDHRVTIRF
ncbi:histidine phosphotransferase family protein [Arenibacterium sp. CAU 1754]